MNKLIFTALLLGSALSAAADPIASFNPGGPNGVFGAAVGESVTTPDGGPWDNISFNYFDDITYNPYAAGGLYVLTQAYTGATGDLSSSTDGYLGFTNTIDNGSWIFSDVTLNPDTQYFFYMDADTPQGTGVLVGSGYAGGIAWGNGGSGDYTGVSSADIQFSLSGDVVSGAPEPGTLALAFGAAGLFAVLRRKTAANVI
ncbi:MAG TPA: PEP-CTERM sorting domain-containing protein [Bryobacteraceae bacterium]|nr:PEP-CTERM sorting domain-containing protein [Bryobacteraceae bacterium]